MKRIISVVLALMMLVGGVLALTSCDKKVAPNLDLEAAKTKLEAAEYDMVKLVDKKEELEPGVAKTFRAYKDGGDETDDQSIYITEYKDKKLAKMYYEQLKASFEQEVANIEAQIKIMEKTLELYEAEMDSDAINELKDEIKELNEELTDYEENFTIGIDGCFVWYGTVKAAEATK